MHESKLKRPDYGDFQVIFLFRQGTVLEEGAELEEALSYFIKDFTVISEETYVHAMAGYTVPLFKQMGVESQTLLRRAPEADFRCDNVGWCRLVSQNCWIGAKKRPDCYVPPGNQGAPWYDDFYHLIQAMSRNDFIVVVRRSA